MKESVWTQRIHAANQRHTEWDAKYRCALMEDYYRGFQWSSNQINVDHVPYTLNMINSTIKLKLANFLVYSPRVIIAPRPGDAAFNLETAIQSAQVKEAFINTLLAQEAGNFGHVVKRAARDSFVRFGVVEVGYSANWIENPKLDKPEYASDRDSDVTRDRVVTTPREVLESERIYFKYVSPKRFRVGNLEGAQLSECNWYGYYEYVYVKDLAKAFKKSLDDFERRLGSSPSDNEDDSSINRDSKQTKVWHIWDNRSRERKIILDADGEELYAKEFTRQSVFDIRWDMDFDGWYPIPPTYQWLSPQDEINDAREQARNHRKIFTRKYQVLKGAVTPEELDKFEYGPDGTIVFVERESAIQPIAAPDLGKASDQALIVPKDDFNLVSATSQEARGIGDRITATQANIIESRSNIREGAETEEINSWLARIIREAILVGGDRLTRPLAIEQPGNRQSEMLLDLKVNRGYNVITPAMLDDGYDFVVLIDVASTSPNQNEIEKQKFLEFIAVLERFPQLSLSPLLIREAAYRVGYRNERVISEMQNAALLQMIGQAAQAQGQGAGIQGNPAGGTAQQITESTTPPTSAGVENQLDNQLVQ